jgi:hypothetical protein
MYSRFKYNGCTPSQALSEPLGEFVYSTPAKARQMLSGQWGVENIATDHPRVSCTYLVNPVFNSWYIPRMTFDGPICYMAERASTIERNCSKPTSIMRKKLAPAHLLPGEGWLQNTLDHLWTQVYMAWKYMMVIVKMWTRPIKNCNGKPSSKPERFEARNQEHVIQGCDGYERMNLWAQPGYSGTILGSMFVLHAPNLIVQTVWFN